VIDPLQQILRQAAATGPVEIAAVVLGFAYILLAIRQRRSCWIAGGLSTALYTLVFLDARLYLQAILQVLYLLLAVHGWQEWGREARAGTGPVVRSLGARTHAAVLAATLALTAVTAPVLADYSDAAAPWADSLGTWSSLAATWLMIRKVAANWLWWIVVDAGLAWLFASQGLWFTAVLYLAFAALAGAGWVAWRRAPQVT
jgi:nicotinamide mononucleotide transporter